MEKRKFGKTGLEVSVLGFGGAEVGFSNANAARVEELLSSALDAGLNVIDTAECYETSEELIGKAVSSRRKEYYLFSKCGHSHGYDKPDWDNIKALEESLNRSLKRLKTDYLDLFQLHSCPKETLERGEVIEFMQKAKQAGKTRFIGYSGDNEAALFAVECGEFDTLQTSVNIADQNVIGQIIPEAAKRGMGVIAKRPIANAAWLRKEVPESDYSFPYWQRLRRLNYDFLNKPKEESVSTALRFTLSIPGISTAIVGTQQPGRWQENAKITAKGPLDQKTFDAVREAWKRTAQPDWIGQI